MASQQAGLESRLAAAKRGGAEAASLGAELAALTKAVEKGTEKWLALAAQAEEAGVAI